MSFAADTKKELMTLPATQCCLIAETSALLSVNGQLEISKEGLALTFSTTSLALARKALRSLKRLYDVPVEITAKKQVRLKKKSVYALRVREKASLIVNELSLLDDESGYATVIDDTLLIKECDRRAYLRGAFIGAGSVNDPGSQTYHLEINVPSEAYANALADVMNGFELNARVIPKRNRYLVYVKESEKIADFLRIIDATHALLAFEDVRIKRDFVNSITRVMNMELANQNKTLAAATKQLRHIAVLENLTDMERLPKTLHEAMHLRKTYPEASLAELSEMSRDHFNTEISKSGLNHRFRNIAQLAEEVLHDFND